MAKQQQWLTREQIDSVLEQLSADDLVKAYPADPDNPLKLPVAMFDNAAQRAGHGEKAIAKVRLTDLNYLTQRLGEVVNVDSPLSAGTSDLLNSPDPGESEA